MNIIIERDVLFAALSFVAKWSDKGATIPVLTHLMMDARDGEVTISATDLDKVAQTTIPAQVNDPGAVCLPSEMLLKAVKGGASTEVSIACDDNGAVIKIGKARLSVGALPADQFPDMVMLINAASYSLSMPAKSLIHRLGKCAPFVWAEQGREFISGVSWRNTQTGLELCGTDGKSLCLIKTGESHRSLEGLNILVPVIDFPAWNGDVEIEASDVFIRFRCGKDVIASKLIEGNFPDVRGIIPPNNQIALTFDRANLARAVGTVDLNATSKENSILFVGRDGKCTLSTRSDKGEIEDVVDYDGPDFVIALASRVISKCLTGAETETIDVLCSDPMTPAIIKPIGDDSLTMIAVPYRDSRLVEYMAANREAA